MTLQEALEKLQQAKDIDDWNNIRDGIKSQLPMNVWLKEFAPTIDGSGLVVEILGSDRPR